MYAPSDGAYRRRGWMARRARDGGFIARMDPSRARVCFSCVALDVNKAQVLGLVH